MTGAKAIHLNVILATALAAQVPVFQSETRIVEIPVIARDSRNSPVADLKPHDLRLLDNGVEQNILTLEMFGGPGQSPRAAAENALSSRLGPRLSIIMLDKLNSPLADQIRGNAAVSDMLQKLAASRDRIAIYSLSEDLHLICDFTTDLDILRSVMNRYQAEELPGGATAPPPLSAPASAAARLPTPVESTGARPDEMRLTVTLDALTNIARRLKNMPGEKSLVWMTAGFPPPQFSNGFDEVSRRLRDAKVRLYPIDARGLIACARLPCPPAVNAHIEMMAELAWQTGGRAYHDNNGLSTLVQAALDDSRQGYLLTYAPNNYRRDASAHTVYLQTLRKGVELRYRFGYVADPPAGN